MDAGMNYGRKEAVTKSWKRGGMGNRDRKSLIVKTCKTPVIIVSSLSLRL
jgi:hypothetical protein